MGKKTRKTRWRTLEIAGESDSEASNTLTNSQISKGYHPKSYYSKFPYSSQSTPTRRYHDAKSTRSSSTASENKITFNEDEYTRITTPRQDVLFKKGYLNKPKNYQTQTSTGNSTTSTGNSTGNGTPDHQSADGTEGTDLEYESQFVFPNSFVDQNGIYYINSFEPYPVVVYNPPICYPEYPTSRSKRYSTDSLTESTSPHNEETSQDPSQSSGETAANVPEINQVFNVLYPGYYFNGVCGSNVITNGQSSTEPRKVRKKRRRKVSKTICHDGTTTTTTTTSDDCESSDEAVTQVDNRALDKDDSHIQTQLPLRLEENGDQSHEAVANDETEEKPKENVCDSSPHEDSIKHEVENSHSKEDHLEENGIEPETPNEEKPNTSETEHANHDDVEESKCIDGEEKSKFNLDAEEFVPRAYREQLPIDASVQFVNIHPPLIPLQLINHPMNELPGPNFPTYLRPSFPVNFIHSDPKMVPNIVNFVPNYVPKTYEDAPPDQKPEEIKEDEVKSEEPSKEVDENTETSKTHFTKNEIDIAKIVSKLEEAAKEQRFYENKKRSNFRFQNKYKDQKARFSYSSETKQRTRSFDRHKNAEGDKSEKSVAEEGEDSTKDEEKKEKESPHVEGIKRQMRQNYSRQNFRKDQSNSPKKSVYLTKSNNELDSPAKPMQNYSETVKKSPAISQSPKCPRFERHQDTGNTQKSPVKQKDGWKGTPPKSLKMPNQWISVSSRKKRKNKGALETEEMCENSSFVDDSADLFESFDVALLVDVVPPSKMEEKVTDEETTPKTDAYLENVVETNDSSQSVVEVDNSELVVQDANKIETESPRICVKEVENKSVQSSKKKWKKGGQKPLTKRVIITDVDLSEKNEKKDEKTVTNANDVSEKDIPTQKEETKIIEEKIEEKDDPKIVEEEITTDKKKSNKKKKKPKVVSNAVPSVSSSSTTLNNLDDSYDFLLDTSVLENEKTNVEVSQELDKMIQKGLFSNLEEKIKCLSAPAIGDDFFRSISFDAALKRATPEKNVIKASDLGTILKNASLGKSLDADASKTNPEPEPSTSGSHEYSERKMNCEDTNDFKCKSNGRLKNKSKKYLPKADESEEKIEMKGDDENQKREEILEIEEDVLVDNTQEEEDLIREGNEDVDGEGEMERKVKKSDPSIQNEEITENSHDKKVENTEIKEDSQEEPCTNKKVQNNEVVQQKIGKSVMRRRDEKKTLYPITMAVREWMTKTRENTPEVEILKSPDTIYKEFIEESDESDTETDQKNAISNPSPIPFRNGKVGARVAKSPDGSDEEMTIFENSCASADNCSEADLLECWEDEMGEKQTKGCETIEEGEDVLQVYESKYGKNEDYLRIQAEIGEMKKRDSAPKHGSFPYRAICCSLM